MTRSEFLGNYNSVTELMVTATLMVRWQICDREDSFQNFDT